MAVTVAHYWLLAGVAFMALEAFGLPGVGFFFAGLGALATGIFISIGAFGEEQWLMQWAFFFAVSAALGAMLWRPIQQWRVRRRGGASKGYDDLIGASATVAAGGLTPGAEGTVLWSGTIMKAELAPGNAALPEGAQVRIVEAKGAKLIVASK